MSEEETSKGKFTLLDAFRVELVTGGIEKYDDIYLHETGWVKCVNKTQHQGEMVADIEYYPPHRIAKIP